MKMVLICCVLTFCFFVGGVSSVVAAAERAIAAALVPSVVYWELHEAIRRAISCPGGTGMHLLGLDGKVDVLPTAAGQAAAAACGAGGAISYAAWSLQPTVGAMGGEIAVKLLVDVPVPVPVPASSTAAASVAASSNSGSSGCWYGQLVVRCSDGALQQAVLADLDYFLYALTAGYASLQVYT
jgi:hypothetical protein